MMMIMITFPQFFNLSIRSDDKPWVRITDIDQKINPIMIRYLGLERMYEQEEKVKEKLNSPQNCTISITFTDESAVSIWLNPSKTSNHLGNTAIYGTQYLLCVELPNYCK
jgi:hypothetical protein